MHTESSPSVAESEVPRHQYQEISITSLPPSRRGWVTGVDG